MAFTFSESFNMPDVTLSSSAQGWGVLDSTWFLLQYLPVNTVWEKQVLDTQNVKNWEKLNLTI